MAIAGDALTSRRAVEARLRGGKADVAGIALQVFLLLSLVISLGVLVDPAHGHPRQGHARLHRARLGPPHVAALRSAGDGRA